MRYTRTGGIVVIIAAIAGAGGCAPEPATVVCDPPVFTIPPTSTPTLTVTGEPDE